MNVILNWLHFVGNHIVAICRIIIYNFWFFFFSGFLAISLPFFRCSSGKIKQYASLCVHVFVSLWVCVHNCDGNCILCACNAITFGSGARCHINISKNLTMKHLVWEGWIIFLCVCVVVRHFFPSFLLFLFVL